MSKLYLILLSVCFSQIIIAQCPVINGAMVNSCSPEGSTAEGNNEFIYFTTGASAAISLYKFSYGSNATPASQSPTGILAGTHAAAKTGTGSFVVQNGCTLHEVTSPSTVIPANSSVVFIPYNFDRTYDISAICKNGHVYVVYIDITPASDSKWSNNGTLANSATSLRYLQLEYNGNACTSGIRSYDGDLWTNPGNIPEADGNSLAWDANGNTLYVNNGCSVITTPVKLISFNAIQNGNDVTVVWKTANQFNTKTFEIEWSSNGSDFKSISTLPASVNSNSIQSYSYIDKNILSSTNFYRLKTIDVDGTIVYSPIVKVNFSGSSLVKVFPQLASDNLTIELNSLSKSETTAMVFDPIGRLLITKRIPIALGYNRVQLNVGSLPTGGYILKLANNNEINTSRFIKK